MMALAQKMGPSGKRPRRKQWFGNSLELALDESTSISQTLLDTVVWIVMLAPIQRMV
jgi:hypothetical protein